MYATYEDVGRLLGKKFTSTSDPPISVVESFIEQADSFINNFCGHDWLQHEVTEYYDGVGYGPRAGVIMLKHTPVLSVKKVEYYSEGKWKDDTYEGMPQDYPEKQCYYVYLDEAKIVFHKLRLTGRKVYRVTYVYGYPSPPAFVRNLSAVLAALKVIAYLSGPMMADYQIGDIKASYPKDGPYTHQWNLLVNEANRLMWQLSARRPLASVG